MRQSQDIVRAFIEENRMTASAEARLLDMMSELGEVAKEVLRASRYGQGPATVSEAMKEELGDLLFSVLAFAAENGIDAERQLALANEKYRRRLAAKGTPGSEANA